MNCSKDCFDVHCCMDKIINSLSPVGGVCDFTHQAGEIVSTTELRDYFAPIIDLYEVGGDKSLAEAINEDWSCFVSTAVGDRLLSDMLTGTEYEPLTRSNVQLAPSIAKLQADWDGFCEGLKHKNRYLVERKDLIDSLREFWLDNFVKVIPADTQFFRAELLVHRLNTSPKR